MANTRKPIVRGLLTEARLADLQPGMVLRLHLPMPGGHWNWYDVRFIEFRDGKLRCSDRFDDSTGINYSLTSIGVKPFQSGSYAVAYMTIRDEELGLRPVL